MSYTLGFLSPLNGDTKAHHRPNTASQAAKGLRKAAVGGTGSTDDRYEHLTRAAIERAQVPIAALIVGALLVADQVPRFRNTTSKFLHLQYPIRGEDGGVEYGIGKADAYFVVTWVVVLTFIRLFLMHYVLAAIARARQINLRKARTRFVEQGWMVTYYTVLWGYGMWLYWHADYWLNCDYLYIGWPYLPMAGLFKAYYLVQTACWIQQIFVLNVEERRKDHWQMFSHHIITVLLCTLLYAEYFTKIGHVILVIMDFGDIFLSGAKILKYLGFTTACDVAFNLFFVLWVVLRHGVYNYVYYHSLFRAQALMEHSRCDVVQAGSGPCWTPAQFRVFYSLLGGLQLITIAWFVMILRVAVKVVTGKGAEDVRSDEDDTDEEVETEVETEVDEKQSS